MPDTTVKTPTIVKKPTIVKTPLTLQQIASGQTPTRVKRDTERIDFYCGTSFPIVVRDIFCKAYNLSGSCTDTAIFDCMYNESTAKKALDKALAELAKK